MTFVGLIVVVCMPYLFYLLSMYHLASVCVQLLRCLSPIGPDLAVTNEVMDVEKLWLVPSGRYQIRKISDSNLTFWHDAVSFSQLQTWLNVDHSLAAGWELEFEIPRRSMYMA